MSNIRVPLCMHDFNSNYQPDSSITWKKYWAFMSNIKVPLCMTSVQTISQTHLTIKVPLCMTSVQTVSQTHLSVGRNTVHPCLNNRAIMWAWRQFKLSARLTYHLVEILGIHSNITEPICMHDLNSNTTLPLCMHYLNSNTILPLCMHDLNSNYQPDSPITW